MSGAAHTDREPRIVAVVRPVPGVIAVFVDGREVDFSEAEARVLADQLGEALRELDTARQLMGEGIVR